MVFYKFIMYTKNLSIEIHASIIKLHFIYSLDVRGKPLGQAQHWSESTSLGKRTSFRTSTPNGLLVEGLKLKVSHLRKTNLYFNRNLSLHKYTTIKIY